MDNLSQGQSRLFAAVTLLEDFIAKWPVVVKISLCCVSHSVHQPSFFPLKAQQGCDCSRDWCSVLTAPLLLEYYSPAM